MVIYNNEQQKETKMEENIDKRTLPKDAEVIKQISDTKREDGRQEILAALQNHKPVEQSDVKLVIPSHRKKQFITFEEYEKLLLEGKTVLELKETAPKHLIAFYGALVKGRINITKEEFEELYNEGKSLDEIAEFKNIPREHITYLREYYGIKRKGAKFLKRINNEKPLSQEAKDVIIGSMLGDGHITKWGYFQEKHYRKQVQYLEWKGEELKELQTDNSYSYDCSIDSRSRSFIESYIFRTMAHSFLYEMRKKFYKEENGIWRKTIPDDMEDLLNDKVLAIWFMDDGNTDWTYRNGIKLYVNALAQCKLSSESFTIKDNIILQNILQKKFNLISNIRYKIPESNEKPYLRLDCESSAKLVSIIKRFVTNDLSYKVDEKEYLKSQNMVVDEEKIRNNFIAKHHLDYTKISQKIEGIIHS